MPTEKVYIGIGSNMGDSRTIVREAINCLDQIPSTCLVAQSSQYGSTAVSDIPQDDYINAAALLETSLEPTRLLANLQSIEHAYYRQRDPVLKWAPRTLDLDIIVFGQCQMADSHLTIPHPEAQNRLFVLQPIFEIGGDFDLPGLGSLATLISKAPEIGIGRLSD